MRQKNLLWVMVFMMMPGCYQSTPATSHAWGDPPEIAQEPGTEDARSDVYPDRETATDIQDSFPDMPMEWEPTCGNGTRDQMRGRTRWAMMLLAGSSPSPYL
jgi:hypothetical protein